MKPCMIQKYPIAGFQDRRQMFLNLNLLEKFASFFASEIFSGESNSLDPTKKSSLTGFSEFSSNSISILGGRLQSR
jgi:hypothetical protein